jgi:excisionase family DNA binding protein
MSNDTKRTEDHHNIPRLLNAHEVSKILSLGISTVYLLIKRKELPCVRFGRAVRVRSEDLEKFIEANTAC